MAVAAKKAAAPNTAGTVNFGELEMYAGGGAFLPEGDYVIEEMNVVMFKHEKSSRAARLGVQITFAELANPEEKKQQFYSMGSKADQSWQPNASGKGIVDVPGASVGKLNDQTNWYLFVKSLYDCGLPRGTFVNDVSALEGIWVHIANVPEPESRKQIKAASTGEAAADQPQTSGTVAVVTEIKDDGKPWENTGGMPEAKASPKASTVRATGAAPAKTATATSVNTGVPTEPDEDVDTAAMNAVAAVLGDKPNGCPKLILQTSVFKALNGKNPEMAQAVISTYFKAGDDTLNTFLEGLGYKLAGSNVVPS